MKAAEEDLDLSSNTLKKSNSNVIRTQVLARLG